MYLLSVGDRPISFIIRDYTKLKLGASMSRRVLHQKNDGGAPRTF